MLTTVKILEWAAEGARTFTIANTDNDIPPGPVVREGTHIVVENAHDDCREVLAELTQRGMIRVLNQDYCEFTAKGLEESKAP